MVLAQWQWEGVAGENTLTESMETQAEDLVVVEIVVMATAR